MKNISIKNITIDGNSAAAISAEKELGGITFWKNKNCIIKNCYVHDVTNIGIQISTSENITITDNEVCNCVYAITAIGIATFGTAAGYSNTGHIIKNNRVHDNYLDGVICNSIQCIISGNVVYGNGVNPSMTASGIYSNKPLSGGDKLVISDNIIYGNDGNGIDLDGITDSVVENNSCIGNNSAGIWVGDGATKNTIRGNLCKNNALNPVPNQADGITLQDNVTYNVVMGNVCYDDQATKTQPYGIRELHVTVTPDYNVITNNICKANKTASILVAGTHSVNANNIS